MIPIRDLHPPSRTPYVTYGLIALGTILTLGLAYMILRPKKG